MTQTPLSTKQDTAECTETIGIVPAPQHFASRAGSFMLQSDYRLYVSTPSLAGTASQLVEEIEEITGVSGSFTGLPQYGGTPLAGSIELVLDPDLSFGDAPRAAAAEGYRLVIDGKVQIRAKTPAGVFLGTRSLLQLLVRDRTLPCGTVTDWPNYPVRGFVLDVGRRFIRPAFIRDYIRFMSWFKLNTFIIHLNDNEIVKDSKRSWDVAQQAFRLSTSSPEFAGLAAADGAYDREDWDSLEDLAAKHHITLVPEIDAPAHARSFIRWKPELGLNGGESDMLDLTKPETTKFIKSLFDEFVPWFRGPAVHFGADEYEKDHAEAYRGFFNTISEHLRGLGKDPMAWGSLNTMSAGAGPLTEDGYNRDVTICSWNNTWYGPRQAINDGYQVINTNDDLLYIVPYAGYYHGGQLNGRELFETWEPHVFGADETVEPGHPQLLGAASAVWNDMVEKEYDEHTIHGMVEPAFAVLAQKMWSGAGGGIGYELFAGHVGSVAAWPGREFL